MCLRDQCYFWDGCSDCLLFHAFGTKSYRNAPVSFSCRPVPLLSCNKLRTSELIFIKSDTLQLHCNLLTLFSSG
jgi:hypothetical protein